MKEVLDVDKNAKISDIIEAARKKISEIGVGYETGDSEQKEMMQILRNETSRIKDEYFRNQVNYEINNFYADPTKWKPYYPAPRREPESVLADYYVYIDSLNQIRNSKRIRKKNPEYCTTIIKKIAGCYHFIHDYLSDKNISKNDALQKEIDKIEDQRNKKIKVVFDDITQRAMLEAELDANEYIKNIFDKQINKSQEDNVSQDTKQDIKQRKIEVNNV